jgi:hypothetical protein
MQGWNINWVIHGKYTKFFRREATMLRDVGKHLLRTLSGKAPYGGADDSALRRRR